MESNDSTPQTVGPQEAPQPQVQPQPQAEPQSQPQIEPPVQPQSTPQPVPQPTPIPQSPEANPVPKRTNKKKLLIPAIVGGLLLIVIIIVLIIVLIPKDNTNNKKLSLDDVRNYCEEEKLSIYEDDDDDDNSRNWIACTTNLDVNPEEREKIKDDDIVTITFSVFNGPVMENGDFKQNYTSLKTGGLVIGEGENYLKMYFKHDEDSNIVVYHVIDGDTYIEVSAVEEKGRKILLDLGYEDKDWPSYEDIHGPIIDEEMIKRDNTRRSDMGRFMAALAKFQADYNSKMFAGPDFWQGEVDFSDCETDNDACMFIKKYLNTSDRNEFKDPDGSYYGLYVTENLLKTERISASNINENSILSFSDDDTYSIAGVSPFSQHIIYLLPGGTCNENNMAVRGTNDKNSALLYMLESGEVYCTNN